MGACWLIWKTDGVLQTRAVGWAGKTLGFTVLGMVAVSAATPIVSPRIFDKWFSFPEILTLAPLPIVSAGVFATLFFLLRHLPMQNDRYSWDPLVLVGSIFVLGFVGMDYSFYPFVVPEQMTIYEAASATESLVIFLVGTLFVLPVILGYSLFSYYIFRGKATELRYD